MIKMRNDVIILGRPIQLQERKKAQMKGVTIGDSLAYKFFDGEYHGMSLLFAEPKGKVAPPRSLPLQQAISLHCSSFLSYSCCQTVQLMKDRDS